MRVLVVAILVVASSLSWSAPKKSVWQPLAKKGATWTLAKKSSQDGGASTKIDVTIADVRKVGKADVARLAYACDGGECSIAELDQIAITDRGAYVFRVDTSDADIAKALKKTVQYADPPRAVKPTARNHYHFVFVPKERKGTYCVGESFEDCGAAPCAAWICVDDTGVVGIGDVGGDGSIYGFEPDGITRG